MAVFSSLFLASECHFILETQKDPWLFASLAIALVIDPGGDVLSHVSTSLEKDYCQAGTLRILTLRPCQDLPGFEMKKPSCLLCIFLFFKEI